MLDQNTPPLLEAMTPRILIIDDNAQIHDDFRKVLERSESASRARVSDLEAALFGDERPPVPANAEAGLKVELDFASQGEEGVEKLKRSIAVGQPYAMAFVDMRMPPGWDGVQTIRELWKVQPNFRVVICTAYSDYSPTQIAAELKMDGRLMILRKPFDGFEIRQLATSMCDQWELDHRKAALEKIVEARTAELKHQASHDALTGLPNRVLFAEHLNATVDRHRRENTIAAVLFIDADGFKHVNDSLGHDAGDALLLQIAERLSRSVRECDTISRVDTDIADGQETGRRASGTLAARLGGDEFAIVLDGIKQDADAARVAQRLLDVAAQPYQIHGQTIQASLSIGITTTSLGYERGEDMLRDADIAMYQAKRAGRARFAIFDKAMHAQAIIRLNFEADLKAAIEDGQIHLNYQPIVNLSDGRLVGFEALARWTHPTRGIISPAEFIPLAEETGIIRALGEKVLKHACQQLAIWQRQWPELGDLTMSVNVSQRQLVSPDVVDRFARIIHESGINPSTLKLEITESSMMNDAKRTLAAVDRIQRLNVHVHMDDFGSGYSSLSALQALPMDGIKIDREFVRNVAEQPDQAAIVRSVVNLAHTLSLPLVAEGIETLEQQDLLKQMGCDMAQGYLYARPMTEEAATAFIAGRVRQRRAA